MKFRKSIMLSVILAAAALSLAGCSQENSASEEQPGGQPAKSLVVYSGAGLRKPMDEIARVFKENTGTEISYNYAGSAQLLSQMELSGEGDVFIPGDTIDMDRAVEKGFAEPNYRKVAYHIPVIGVPEGNPAGITRLEDLARPGLKVIIGDEKANAIGKLAVKIFQKNNLWEDVQQNIVARDATVNEVVTHTVMKQCDASIVTEDNAVNVKDMEYIQIPAEQNEIETIPIGVLTFSQHPDAAKQFADFVSSSEGREIFLEYGFKPVD